MNGQIDKLDWLRERQRGVGGSDAAAIVGLNPYKSALSVWQDKTAAEPIEIPDNEAMRQGRDLEQYVVERFELETGKQCRRVNQVIYSEKYPFALANIDRKVKGEDAGLECKTTNMLNLKRFKNGEYPAEYYCQCLHYLAVTGFNKWYLAVLVFNRGFMIFEIERDEDEISALMAAEGEFWDEYVATNTQPPPELYKASSDEILKLYPQGNGGSIELFGRDTLIREYLQLKVTKSAIEKELDEKEAILKADMGTNEIGVADCFKISWANQVRNTFDVALLKNAYPDLDVSTFYKTTSFRKFSIKENNNA